MSKKKFSLSSGQVASRASERLQIPIRAETVNRYRAVGVIPAQLYTQRGRGYFYTEEAPEWIEVAIAYKTRLPERTFLEIAEMFQQVVQNVEDTQAASVALRELLERSQAEEGEEQTGVADTWFESDDAFEELPGAAEGWKDLFGHSDSDMFAYGDIPPGESPGGPGTIPPEDV